MDLIELQAEPFCNQKNVLFLLKYYYETNHNLQLIAYQ